MFGPLGHCGKMVRRVWDGDPLTSDFLAPQSAFLQHPFSRISNTRNYFAIKTRKIRNEITANTPFAGQTIIQFCTRTSKAVDPLLNPFKDLYLRNSLIKPKISPHPLQTFPLQSSFYVHFSKAVDPLLNPLKDLYLRNLPIIVWSECYIHTFENKNVWYPKKKKYFRPIHINY